MAIRQSLIDDLRQLTDAVSRIVRQKRQRLHQVRQHRRVAAIVADTRAPDTSAAEADCDRLLAEHRVVPPYPHDPLNAWQRAVDRTAIILRLPHMAAPGKKVIEIGCYDGRIAQQLHAFGHHPVLSDIEDQRHELVKQQQLPFVLADVCQREQLPVGPFDLAISYNAFEHFDKPDQALANMAGLLAPGGLIHICFGTVYSSPWGSHWYAKVPIPYLPYLFSESFNRERLGWARIGLNGWRFSQYLELVQSFDGELLSFETRTHDRHLDIVERYPDSFRGRQLTVDDLITTDIITTIRPKG